MTQPPFTHHLTPVFQQVYWLLALAPKILLVICQARHTLTPQLISEESLSLLKSKLTTNFPLCSKIALPKLLILLIVFTCITLIYFFLLSLFAFPFLHGCLEKQLEIKFITSIKEVLRQPVFVWLIQK